MFSAASWFPGIPDQTTVCVYDAHNHCQQQGAAGQAYYLPQPHYRRSTHAARQPHQEYHSQTERHVNVQSQYAAVAATA
jgi:hypothetical protein